jgi:hypothetical protein
MLAVFWAVMSAARFAVEYLFKPLGLIPNTRPHLVAMEGLSWNYTTFLNMVALVIFAGLYWLYRTGPLSPERRRTLLLRDAH